MMGMKWLKSKLYNNDGYDTRIKFVLFLHVIIFFKILF